MNGVKEIQGRKILFENEVAEMMGMYASCNACDRIIFEDEMKAHEYTDCRGYCPQCKEESDEMDRRLKEARDTVEALKRVKDDKDLYLICKAIGKDCIAEGFSRGKLIDTVKDILISEA